MTYVIVHRCQVVTRIDGTVVNISGMPPMYDYEFFPQNVRSIRSVNITCTTTPVDLSSSLPSTCLFYPLFEEAISEQQVYLSPFIIF